MGCVTSKGSATTSIENPKYRSSSATAAAVLRSHVVSLVSTSYGVLNLDTSSATVEIQPSRRHYAALVDDKGNLDLGHYVLHRHSDKSTQTDTPVNQKKGTASRVLRSSENPPSPASMRRNSSRRSVGTPIFDPKLIAFFEKEALLESFELRCPPGGEKTVVLYTTTLRGIRKTFEECNAVRAAVESHGVEVVERDVSMDSGFREELRTLMGGEVKVPVVFVKGRLVGGMEVVVKLEEEGKMATLMEGLEKKRDAAGSSCVGCGGVRFVVCMECHGSCRLVDDDGRVVECRDCNENGLIYCPICS